jgi:hypothetical protein
MGSATNGGGGYDPGPNEDQAILFEVQGSGFDPASQTYLNNGAAGTPADCPQRTRCIPEGYVSPIYIYCDDSWSRNAYNDSDARNERSFTHKSSEIAKTNRYTGSGGSCPQHGQFVAGGSGQTYYQVFDFHDRGTHSPYKYWIAEWPRLASNKSWKATFIDNFGFSVPQTGGVIAHPYANVADWRSTITRWMAELRHPIVVNSLGPGGGYYPGTAPYGTTFRDAAGNSGVVNWTVDTDDVCRHIGRSGIRVLFSEKPFASVSNGSITYLSYNFKTLLNSVSHIWSNRGCSHTDVEMLNFASDGRTSNIHLREYTKVAEFLMEPTHYDGHIGSRGVVERRYATCVNCSTQLAVVPEDELVFVPDPSEPLKAWFWGGKSDGSGCQVSGAKDRGGTAGFAQSSTCGMHGQVDSGGYSTPVYVREGTCYKSGVSLGHCAGVMDTCYNGNRGNGSCPAIHLSHLRFKHGYAHAVSLNGGDLRIDPNTHAVINPNERNGGTISVRGTKPSQLTGCGTNFQSRCAVILTR